MNPDPDGGEELKVKMFIKIKQRAAMAAKTQNLREWQRDNKENQTMNQRGKEAEYIQTEGRRKMSTS